MKSLKTSLGLVLIALAIFPSLSHSQSLTLGPTPRQVFCAGDQFEIAYTAAGYTSSKNSFVIQMSDASGSFFTFKSIGSVRTTNSGNITATIPNDVKNGIGYRFRVMSSDPYVVSGDNGANLTIGGVPVPSTHPADWFEGYTAMIGEPITLQHQSRNAASVLWDFGPDADPTTSTENNPTVRFSTPGYKVVHLTAFSESGCDSTIAVSIASPEEYNGSANRISIYVGSCTPSVPSYAKIDSMESKFDFREHGTFWVVPGGVHDEFGPVNSEFLVEPGGTVHGLSYYNIVYLKAGATLSEPSRGSFVIYESGASIDEGSQGVTKRQCSDLEFGYTDAPPYKIQQASVIDKKELNAFIYPNPSSTSIYREDVSERLIEARLYSVTGSLVKTTLEPRSHEIMSVHDVAPGLYSLELQYSDRVRFQKILIQK
jgi:PKD repeat protein